MPRSPGPPIEKRLEAALLEAFRQLRPGLPEARGLAARAAALAAAALLPGTAKTRSRSRLRLQAPHFFDEAERRRFDRELSRALGSPSSPLRHELVFEDVFTELYAPQTDFAALLVYEPCLRFLARQGRLAPLDEVLAPASPLYHDLGLRRGVEGGSVFGLPLFLSTRALYYRADLLAKHGLKAPRTFDELEEAAAFVLKREERPGLAGLALDAAPLNRFNLVVDLLWAQGADLFEGQGPWRFPAAAWRKALGRLGRWARSRLLAPECLRPGALGAAADFLRGGALFCLDWTDALRHLHALGRAERSRFGWALHPREDAAASLQTRLGGPSLVLPQGSRHRAHGLKLARALAEPAAQERLFAKGGWPFPAQTALWGKPALRRANPWLEEAERFLAPAALLEEKSYLQGHYLHWQNAVNAELEDLASPGKMDEALARIEAALGRLLPFRPYKGFVAQAMALIDARASGPLDVAGLASELKVSREHFIREFKRQSGATPLKFIQKKQMEKAKELLQTTHYHVGEVARMLGYEDLGHFARLFKAVVRKNPSAFKRGGF